MDKYLVASGCSYTGGGGFNNLQIFTLEFPDINPYVFHTTSQIDWSDLNFKKFLRPHLWPYKLGKLLNYKASFNLGSGGKGIETSTSSIYHFIYDWQRKGNDIKELEIWYQIPSPNRLESYVNNEDKHKCIITDMPDTSPIKQNFITNFFDEDYNLLSAIHQLYKLKKYCDALGITIYFIPWEFSSYHKHGEYYTTLKNRISEYGDDENKSHFIKPFTNIDSILYYNIDNMLDELKCIFIENRTINDYLEEYFDVFYFQSKYPNVTDDRHMTYEGHTEFAKLLKKIVKKDLENS